MGLRIFSVTGEALNFGGRRMETIARVAWLPVVMLLIVNMTTVFAYLSVIAGQPITFAEISTFTRAQQLVVQFAERGFEKSPNAMWAITAGNVVMQTLLIASFMAPLIRYAGLGERPAPGVVKLAFGPDQLRFIISGALSFLFIVVLVLAPIMAATFYVAKYIIAALSQTVASFPDPDSLHTIELTTAAESLTARGGAWIYDLAIPSAAAAPFALLLWLVVLFHFHPRNRPAIRGRNVFLRGLVTLLVTGGFLAGGYWFLREQILQIFAPVAALGQEPGQILEQTPLNTKLLFGVVIYFLVSYFNLRLYPYPGVSVCRKSLLLGNTLKASRGWDIIRLQIILVLIGMFLLIVQYAINSHAMGWILQALSVLYQAVASYTRLLSSGVTGEWVAPLFVWIWNGIKILVNVFWTFFSYGVVAGLYGRLYRESEREDATVAAGRSGGEVWRRNTESA